MIDNVEETSFDPPELREGESSLPGRNNQLIIFGRDRPSDKESGHGGEVNAGTIHIVVGRSARDPNFKDDKSFIYTTMLTDVDKNLSLDGMTDGKGADVGPMVGPAIIAKSDNVRVVHRSSGDVRISSDDGKNFILLSQTRCEIKLGASWLKIEDGTITVESGKIKLGDKSEKNHVVLGDDFMKYFNQHTHMSPVGPTSQPIALMTPDLLSAKSFVE